jgi:hypothetical protein
MLSFSTALRLPADTYTMRRQKDLFPQFLFRPAMTMKVKTAELTAIKKTMTLSNRQVRLAGRHTGRLMQSRNAPAGRRRTAGHRRLAAGPGRQKNASRRPSLHNAMTFEEAQRPTRLTYGRPPRLTSAEEALRACSGALLNSGPCCAGLLRGQHGTGSWITGDVLPDGCRSA